VAKATPADLARWLGDAWARYMCEYLAELDGVTEGRLSAACGKIGPARKLLTVAVQTGQYQAIPIDTRRWVEAITAHIRKQHPEFADLVELMETSPGAATLALRDQLDAVRRDAEAAYGNRPE